MSVYNNPIPDNTFPDTNKTVKGNNKESLVIVNADFICDSMYYHWKENNNKPILGSSPTILLRKTVREMLICAESLLPKGYNIKIYDGWRPIKVQQMLWNHYRDINIKSHPEMNDSQIDELTRKFVSKPSLDMLHPSLHNTGGSVDLTIIDPFGDELDMGCEFDDFSPKANTSYFENATSEHDILIRNNRRMLYNIMTAVGFTNLPSEWWHYDYGNSAWAYFTNNEPIYPGLQ